MSTIMIINDCTEASRQAAQLAFDIAKNMQYNLLLANVSQTQTYNVIKSYVKAGVSAPNDERYNQPDEQTTLLDELRLLSHHATGFVPRVTAIKASGSNEEGLAQYINNNDVKMIIKTSEHKANMAYPDMQKVLNRVNCPLLLVPGHCKPAYFKRITYFTDLRYCKLNAVFFLAALARPNNASLHVAHLSLNGLPDMKNEYAFELFNDNVSKRINYDEMRFSNIANRDFEQVLDVMINGMQCDLLVLDNHQFHFEQIIGQSVSGRHLQAVPVPMLIFPC